MIKTISDAGLNKLKKAVKALPLEKNRGVNYVRRRTFCYEVSEPSNRVQGVCQEVSYNDRRDYRRGRGC